MLAQLQNFRIGLLCSCRSNNWLFGCVLALALIGCETAGDGKNSSGTSGGDSGKAIHLTAIELQKAYIDNEKAASDKYHGKLVEVEGKVVETVPFALRLTAGDQTVSVALSRKVTEHADSENLPQPGTMVVVKGKCFGLSGKKSNYPAVRLLDCRIVRTGGSTQTESPSPAEAGPGDEEAGKEAEKPAPAESP